MSRIDSLTKDELVAVVKKITAILNRPCNKTGPALTKHDADALSDVAQVLIRAGVEGRYF